MMLEELQRRNYSAITTRNYLRVVTEFAKYFGQSPDKLGSNELRTYQAYLLTERKLTPGTVVNRVAALRFFFVKTLKRHQFRDFLPYPQDRRRLPTVLSREEVARLIDAAGTLFRRTLLMTLYATGMRRSELARLKVSDIDSQRMIIRVVEGKGGKDREIWAWWYRRLQVGSFEDGPIASIQETNIQSVYTIFNDTTDAERRVFNPVFWFPIHLGASRSRRYVA
jgi:site-specific recombinase XerD